MKTIMFDVDGVLADFVEAFIRTARALFPDHDIPYTHTLTQPTWNFGQILDSRVISDTWLYIKHTPEWWESLSSLEHQDTFRRINELQRRALVYFVTSRPSAHNAQRQTSNWLRARSIESPSVIVSKRKGDAARLIGAHFSLEDKWCNAQCVHWISDEPIQTKSYLIDRLYNQVSSDVEIGAAGVVRVASVSEFLDAVEDEE